MLNSFHIKFKWFDSYTFLRAFAIMIIISLLSVSVAMAAGGDTDPNFYGGAIYIHSRNGFSSSERDFVALQSNGKIIIAGNGTCNPDCDVIVLRRNSDGTPDPIFGVNGARITDLGRNENVYGMAIQSDNKIVVSGSRCDSTGGDCRLFLMRYTADGVLDSSFHGNGVFTLGGLLGPESMGSNIAIRPNGKIVMLGQIEISQDTFESAVFQFNLNGSLDRTFGSVNKRIKLSAQRIGFAFINLYGNDLMIQLDGKIIVAGSLSDKNYSSNFALVRLLSNGEVDSSFGQGGAQITDFGGEDDWATSVDIGPDGKIILAGSSYINGKENFAVARYNSNGSLDMTFNGTGFVNTDVELGNNDSDGSGAWDVLVQSDGKILALGHKNPYGLHQDITLVRYNGDGSLDTTFGSNGMVVGGLYTENYGSSIALQPDGKYLIASLSLYITGSGDNHYFTLDRILP